MWLEESITYDAYIYRSLFKRISNANQGKYNLYVKET